jgi:hypothetical protein
VEVEVLGVGAMEEEVQLEVAAAEVVEVCVSVLFISASFARLAVHLGQQH